MKEREGRREEGARENLNLKTLILKDSSIWSIRNYLTFTHRQTGSQGGDRDRE